MLISFYVPYFTRTGNANVFLNYLTSTNVSVNDRYIVPKKNSGFKNCIISVWIMMMSPVDMIPCWV